MPIHRTITVLSLGFALLHASCTRAVLDGTPASVGFGQNGLDFGQVGVGQTATMILSVQNLGETGAKIISTGFDKAGFHFSGGAFPGENGDCGQHLESHGTTCTLDLAFSPTAEQRYTSNLLFTYHDGTVQVQAGVPISGTGVTSGTQDSLFGNGGLLTLDLGGNDSIVSLDVNNAGKIVSAGVSDNGVTKNIALVELGTDGQLDASFGIGGVKRLYVGTNTNDPIGALTLQIDGKPILAGGSNALTGTTALDLSVLRTDTSGNPDTSFGGTGLLNLDLLVGALSSETQGLAINAQVDGTTLVAGSLKLPALNSDFLLSKVTSTGAMDPTFGVLGLATVGFGVNNTDVANGIAVQSNGASILGGTTDNGVQKDSALARVSALGSIDLTFGTLGKTSRDVCGTNKDDEIKAEALQPDGKLVVVGYCKNASNNKDIFVARFTSTGAIDPTFGTGGVYKLDVTGFDEELLSVAIQSDGKIVVGGYTNTGTTEVPLLARLTSGGILDSTFGTNGLVAQTVGSGNARILTLDLANSKINVGGLSSNGVNNDAFFSRYFQ